MTTALAGAGAEAGAGPVPEVFARDAIIAWFRGEFAAANAIIDALCGHLVQIEGGSGYEAVFAAIHRRRMNWIPVLHMQKFFSIADVTSELRRVAACRHATASTVEEAEIKKGEDEAAPAMEKETHNKDSPKEEEEEEEQTEEERPIDDGGARDGDSSDPKVSEEEGEGGGDGGEQFFSLPCV